MPAGNGRVVARRSYSVRVAAAVALAVALGVSSGACSSSSKPAATSTRATTPELLRVDVFGDSLVVQAADALRVEGRAHGLDVTVAAFFGLAPCDLLRSMRDDLARPPRVLVLAFSGNNITPCMNHDGQELTGAAYFAAYRRDVTDIVTRATSRNVPVLIVGPPFFPPERNVPDRVELNAVYRTIAQEHPGARYVATSAALGANGYTATLPCSPGETATLGCRAGLISVRGPERLHFDEPRTVPCPNGHDVCRYTAGGHRYADAILEGIATVTGSGYRPAAATVGVPIDVTRDG